MALCSFDVVESVLVLVVEGTHTCNSLRTLVCGELVHT